MPRKSGQAEKDQGVLKKNWDDGVYISQRSIWVQTDLNIYEKMVWMCLEKYANGKDAAWPSRSTLAEECSISVSQVKRTISSLISKGLLEKKVRRNNDGSYETNLYTLFLPNQRKSERLSDRVPQTLGVDQGVGSDRPQGVGSTRTQGRSCETPGVGPDRPQGRVCQDHEHKRNEQIKEEQQQADKNSGAELHAVVVEIKNQKSIEQKNNLLIELQKLGFSNKKAKELIEQFDEEKIRKTIDYVNSDHKIKKKAGFLIKALEDDYLLSGLNVQQPKEDYLKIKTEKYLQEMKEAEKNADIEGFTRFLQSCKPGKILSMT